MRLQLVLDERCSYLASWWAMPVAIGGRGVPAAPEQHSKLLTRFVRVPMLKGLRMPKRLRMRHYALKVGQSHLLQDARRGAACACHQSPASNGPRGSELFPGGCRPILHARQRSSPMWICPGDLRLQCIEAIPSRRIGRLRLRDVRAGAMACRLERLPQWTHRIRRLRSLAPLYLC